MADLKMPEVNCVIICGNLIKDPIFRKTSNEITVVNFAIASNRRYKDTSNQWQEDVCYIGVVAWNKLAESCRDKLKKGSAVLVDGELQTRIWKYDNGLSRAVIEIKARRIQFLSRRGKTIDEISPVNDENDVFINDEIGNYSDDSFNKFIQEDV
ncbi:MAG: single-stranded DNA-binding protein [Ignavibacteriaceae bacterium]